MYIQKSVIDENGFWIKDILVNENGDICFGKLKSNERIVKLNTKVLIKPQFKNNTWTEGASQEEIENLENKNNTENEVTIEERLESLEEVIKTILGGELNV